MHMPDTLPDAEEIYPWIASSELRRILHETPADPDLLDDLADVRDIELDD